MLSVAATSLVDLEVRQQVEEGLVVSTLTLESPSNARGRRCGPVPLRLNDADGHGPSHVGRQPFRFRSSPLGQKDVRLESSTIL